MTAEDNALYALAGIENGDLANEKVAKVLAELDPVMVFFILKFLRDKYPASNPASTGVLERMVTLLNTHTSVLKQSKQGEKDPVVEWFLETYDLKSYFKNPEGLFQMLQEKLDS